MVLLGCLIVKVKIEKNITCGTTVMSGAMYSGFKGVHLSDDYCEFTYDFVGVRP